MSWRERYRVASWRGIPFRVGVAGELAGRRLVRHEFPHRDVPYLEDLGRRAKSFRVEGWVVGEDYDLTRDELIAAAEEAGPGILVHPNRGRVLVVCEGLEVREETILGGTALLAFVFVEAGRASSPDEIADPAGALELAAEPLYAAAQAAFEEALVVTGPQYVLDGITASVRAARDWLASLHFDGPPATVAMLAEGIFGIVDVVLDTAYDPTRLAPALFELIRLVPEGYRARQEALRVLEGAYDVESPTFDGLGLQGVAAANGQAVIDLLQTSALAAAAGLAGRIDYESLDEAIDVRQRLAELVDRRLLRAGDEETVLLEDLRSALFRAVPPPGEGLPHLTSITPLVTLPSIVLAYGLYRDGARGAEIAARNRIEHPGFCAGDVDLEVLSA